MPNEHSSSFDGKWGREIREAEAKERSNAATPPTTPSDAAMRAVEEIVRLIQDEYEHGAASVEPEIAAIITRHLAAGAGTWATIKQTCGFCGQRVEHVCTAFLKGAAATTTPEATPNYALVQLLDAAMLHPEQAEGYIRRVIAELGDTSPETPVESECVGCVASHAGLGRCRIHEPTDPVAVADNEGERLDPAIAPLVHTLNTNGIRTFQSCSGHADAESHPSAVIWLEQSALLSDGANTLSHMDGIEQVALLYGRATEPVWEIKFAGETLPAFQDAQKAIVDAAALRTKEGEEK